MLYYHPEVMVSDRPGEGDKPVKELVVVQKPKGLLGRILKPRVRQYLDIPIRSYTGDWESRWYYYPSMKPVKPFDRKGMVSKEIVFIYDMVRIFRIQDEFSSALDRHIEY